NAAVARMLAREPDGGAPAAPAGGSPAPAPPLPRVDFVFLMGDESSDVFFANARTFFQGQGTIVVADSLSAIMAEIGRSKNPIGKLTIVSHAHESGSLQFKIDANDPNNRLDFDELKKANADGTLPSADAKKVDKDTQIVIRGCNIGRSKLMLDQLDKAFGGASKVSAPTHEQGYGPDASGAITEKMAGFFVEQKGIPKTEPSNAALQPRFAAKYPFVPKKDWAGLLKQKTTISDRQGPWEQTRVLPADVEADVLAAFGPQLDQARPASEGWSVKYKGRTVAGRVTTYKFESSRIGPDGSPEKAPDTIPITTPTQAELEQMAKADLARPDAYSFTAMKSAPGAGAGETVFSIEAERSEWIVKHVPIKDGGKEVDPPPTDTKWWGESDFAP
ncbi:MAG: hypothetical protein ACRDLN_03810, partial [Solirubrobacteraceae bacterium]